MASSNGFMDALGRILRDVLNSLLKSNNRSTTRRRTTSSGSAKTPPLSSRYPGDYRGRPSMTYAPQPGRTADPGEVVWTWVPFEEDHSQGKDRPVLLVGREGDWLLGVALTSKDHDRDARQEAAAGRYWVDVGTGPWDPQRRPSEVRVNRIVRVNPDEVRRISERIPKDKFDKVAAAIRRHT